MSNMTVEQALNQSADIYICQPMKAESGVYSVYEVVVCLSDEVKRLQSIIDHQVNLQDELTAHRAYARGEYWAWQGDEYDHPESLVCPVLISAKSLRKILAKAAPPTPKL